MQNRKKTYYAARWGIIAFLAWFFVAAGNAQAVSTPAGTAITNTVAVSFVQDGATHSLTAGNSFLVDRAINMVVTKNSDVNTAPTSSNVATVVPRFQYGQFDPALRFVGRIEGHEHMDHEQCPNLSRQ